MREFSKISSRRCISTLSSLNLASERESTEMDKGIVESNFGMKNNFISRFDSINSHVSTGIIRLLTAIAGVFNLCADAKIFVSIIERISVYMIPLTRISVRDSEYVPMKANFIRSRRLRNKPSANCIEGLLTMIPSGAPFESGKFLKAMSAYLRKLTLRKWDETIINRWGCHSRSLSAIRSLTGCINIRRPHSSKLWLILALLFPLPLVGQTIDAFNGACTKEGVQATVSGISSTNRLDGIIPHCTVTVYLTGTLTKATIYADASHTVLSNPFTGDALGTQFPGKWIFWAADNQGYDVVMSGGDSPLTYPTPRTLTDLKVGGGGGGGSQTIIEVNGVATSPVSPVDFVDTGSVTWHLTGATITATASGGGSGCSVVLSAGDVLWSNGSGGCIGSDLVNVNPAVIGTFNPTLTISNNPVATGDSSNIDLESFDSRSSLNISPKNITMNCDNSGTSGLGCNILIEATDLHATTPGLTPLTLILDPEINSGAYEGILISYQGAPITTTHNAVGTETDMPVTGTYGNVYGHFLSLGGGSFSEATTEEVGLLIGTTAAQTSKYCGIVTAQGTNPGTRTNHLQLDCGTTKQSTFAGPVNVTASGVSSFQIGTNTFSALNAAFPCSGSTEGMDAPVTDSSTNTWGATVTGGGSNHIKAYCDGTNWTVEAK